MHFSTLGSWECTSVHLDHESALSSLYFISVHLHHGRALECTLVHFGHGSALGTECIYVYWIIGDFSALGSYACILGVHFRALGS